MTPAEIAADIDATIALWRRQGVSTRELWFALTGRHAGGRWREIEAWMIRYTTAHRPSVRFRFEDDPRAMRRAACSEALALGAKRDETEEGRLVGRRLAERHAAAHQ